VVEYDYISHVPVPSSSTSTGYAIDEEGIFLLDTTIACHREKIHREEGENLVEDPDASYWVILSSGNRVRVSREAYERAREYLKNKV
jgi:hypothetical protein